MIWLNFTGNLPDEMANILNVNRSMIFFIVMIVETLGFKASLSGKSLYIYDAQHIANFFDMARPKNLKHNLKYNLYMELGRVITHQEYCVLLDAAVV